VRVFLDTNVLVSAFAARGICADLMELVLLHHDFVTGRNVLRELERVLEGKLRLPAARTKEIVRFIGDEAVAVIESAAPVALRVEPADALVLGEAKLGAAEVFVTGDAQLLALGSVDAMRVVTPRQFWELLHAGDPGTGST